MRSNYFLIRLLCLANLSVIFFTSCSYPFASISSRGILPHSRGSPWLPPSNKWKKFDALGYTEKLDPNIEKGPLSLNQIINFSLSNNPNTSISWANVQGAIASLVEARTDYFPKLQASGVVARDKTDNPFNFQTNFTSYLTTWGPIGDLSYTLWDFGARFEKSTSALQALYAMSFSYNQQLQDIIKDVTNDYFSHLFEKATLGDRQQDVSDAFLILESAQKKLQSGVANVTDLVQAQTTYLSAQVDLVRQKDSADNSLVALAKDMGMPGDIIFTTQEFPSQLPGREYLVHLDEFISIAMNNRPELIKYKAQVLSKKAALKFANLDPLPKFTGDLNLKYQDYSGGFDSSFDIHGEIKVSWILFEGFFFRSQIRKARAEYKKALSELQQQQDVILAEVTTYHNNYKNAIEAISCTRAYVDSAKDEFNVTLSNYRAGTGDIINVMQAQTTLSNARSQYSQSVRDIFISLTNLAYATGSLVSPSENSDWQAVYHFNEAFDE